MKKLKRILINSVLAVLAIAVFPSTSFATPDSTYPFEMEVSQDKFELMFYISAKGTFNIECGTNGILYKNSVSLGASYSSETHGDTDVVVYKCFYDSTSGSRRFRLGSSGVSAYSNDNSSFLIKSGGEGILGLYGSLGAVFPTLSSGAVVQPLFESTFSGTTGILTPIPEGFLNGISGAPRSNMFKGMFMGSYVVGPLPNGLFRNITGAGADGVFSSTFFNCPKLTGGLPTDFFGNFTSVGTNMFDSMFAKSTSFGANTFIWKASFEDQLRGLDAGDAMLSMFSGTSFLTACPSSFDTFTPSPYNYTSRWDGGIMCEPTFWVKTTNDTTDFRFRGYFSGTLYVDCGSGGHVSLNSGTINSPSTTSNQSGSYSANAWKYVVCKYDTVGEHTVAIGTIITNATPYDSYASGSYVTIDFGGTNTNLTTALKVAQIGGSLGKLFPKKSGSSISAIPIFKGTFLGCSNLTGEIPGDLFNGLAGNGGVNPRKNMFYQTFKNCSSLTGIVPNTLFSALSSTTFNSVSSSDIMPDVFKGTSLSTCCPVAEGGAVTTSDTGLYSWASYTSSWATDDAGTPYDNSDDVFAVACNTTLTNNQCALPVQDCQFATKLGVGVNGALFNLYQRDANTTGTTLNVKSPNGNEVCYVKFESGDPSQQISGTLRLKVGGTSYYAIPDTHN